MEKFKSDEADALILKWEDLIIGRETEFLGQVLKYTSVIKRPIEGSVLFNIEVNTNGLLIRDLSEVVNNDGELLAIRAGLNP